MTTYTRLSLSLSFTLFSLLVLRSLPICSSAFFSSYSLSPLMPSGHKHPHVTHVMKHNEHTHMVEDTHTHTHTHTHTTNTEEHQQ